MPTPLIPVSDSGDPRLADYARLTDARLRRKLETGHGLFVAEGEKVIRRAIAAGYPVRSLLVTRDRLAGLTDLTASWLAAADTCVAIPMSGAVSSLNVASAAAIACYLLGPGNR